MTGRQRTVWLLAALAAAQAGAVVVYRWVERARQTAHDQPFEVERLAPRPAPELPLLGLDGARHGVADYRGRPLLLHFWATWCLPCKEELPQLLELGRELERDGGARVLAVATDAGWDDVREFFHGRVPASVLLAPAEAVAQAYEVSVLPDTYLVAADGTLVLRAGGARDWSSPAARSTLRAAAARTAPDPARPSAD